MRRVSSNAGKDPYRRSDFISPFNPTIKKKGIPFNFNIKPNFTVKIDTEYCDNVGNKLYFKDIIIFENEEYEIGYDGKEFNWIIFLVKNNEKKLKLKLINQSISLHKKYNKN